MRRAGGKIGGIPGLRLACAAAAALILCAAETAISPKEAVARRAERLAQRLAVRPGFSVRVREGESVIGGGSTPGQSLPTVLVAVTHARYSAQKLEALLRRHSPPVLGRVERDELLLDLRTVFEDEDEELAQAFDKID
jgi:L-seryl-tRNA(Ser) seleniumtransferase